MRDVLRLLAETLPDPNGLDLYFTYPYKKLTGQKKDALLREYDKRPLGNLPDLNKCVANIVDDYKKRSEIMSIREEIRHPNSTSMEGPRKLTLYVFTDGTWHRTMDLAPAIESSVRYLWEQNKQVRIRFILFGHDKGAIKKLETLDSGLGQQL